VLDPRDLPPDALLAEARRLGANDLAVRRLMSALLGQGVHDPAVWGRAFQVPRRLGDAIGDLSRLTLDRVVTSPHDGFKKLRFLTQDRRAVETVLIPLHKPGAVSVCLSSQVGCAMACVFCATARMANRRNLAGWEILDQWVQARDLARSQGRRVTGAVFMGMGEPFLNYGRVLTAAERLVPVAARTPVAEVMAAARRHALARGDRVMLSYVCIRGENVGEDDARALGALVGDSPVRFDLIDITDPTGRFEPPTAEELQAFRDALTRHLGQPVVRRYSGGADIQAACGTLAGN
jgi:23S rRNA (adenine2503-C2)-methyltransferase